MRNVQRYTGTKCMQCAPGYFPFFGSCEPADSSLSLAEIPLALASAAVSRLLFRWLESMAAHGPFCVGEQCYAENSMIHQFGSSILNIVPVWITWLVINRWMDFAPLHCPSNAFVCACQGVSAMLQDSLRQFLDVRRLAQLRPNRRKHRLDRN